MIQVELAGQTVTLPELRCFHKISTEQDRMGPVLAVDNPFGKTWVSAPEPVAIGSVFEMDIPAGDEFQTVRMRAIRAADRHELIAALKASPRKLTLAKGHWYEVLAD